MERGGKFNALAWCFGRLGHQGGKQRRQKEDGEKEKGMILPVRPAFRVEVKVRISKSDGSYRFVWLTIPESFSGQNIECALAHAVDKAGEEVRRIASRPAYNFLEVMGAEYHVLNVRFVRTDTEDEDGE